MSKERVALLRYLGAEVVLTPGILIGVLPTVAARSGKTRIGSRGSV
jgi:hypothetical protein